MRFGLISKICIWSFVFVMNSWSLEAGSPAVSQVTSPSSNSKTTISTTTDKAILTQEVVDKKPAAKATPKTTAKPSSKPSPKTTSKQTTSKKSSSQKAARAKAINAKTKALALADSIKADSLRTDSLKADTAQVSVEEQLQGALSTIQELKVQDSIRAAEFVKQLQEIQLRTKDSLIEAQISKINLEDSLRRADLKAGIDSIRHKNAGINVNPFDSQEPLFVLYAGYGNLNVDERVKLIEERIKEIASNPLLNIDSIKVIKKKDLSEISYQQKMVMQIIPQDEVWFNAEADSLAGLWVGKIKTGILEYRDNVSLQKIATQIGLTLAAVCFIGLLFWLINRVFGRILLFIAKRRRRFVKGVVIQNYDLFSPEQHWRLYRRIVVVLRTLIHLLSFYVTLPLIFAIFPWTRGIAETLLHYIILPAKTIGIAFITFLPNALTIVVILITARYLIKGLRYFANEINDGKMTFSGFYPDWAIPTFNIIKVITYALVFVLIFPYLPGSNSPVFKGVSVFLGVLFSLGSTSFIGNIVAGLVVTYMRPFRIGDRIKIGNISGKVIQKNLLVTRIRTPQKEDITLPNSNVMSGHTINYTTSAESNGLHIVVNVSIGYDVPHTKVKELLMSAAGKTNGVVAFPASFVLVSSLEDFYIAYELNASIRNTEIMPKIKSELHSNILDLFAEAKVEILSPHYRANRDGNASTV